ncbi:MAG TPA: YceI family protein [Cyclobacteriaceae bacterium]|nr:YceI family protein [Cyclobacteriaceae bacterium]
METLTTTKWGIDTTHSEVQFKVKHLVIATVTGFFRKFEGSVEAESEDFDGAKVEFSIDTNSIDTNQADRDAHLKSADFFAAEQYPQIKFSNGKLTKNGESYSLTGDLTIRETTKQVTLDVDFGGVMADPWGNVKAGFELSGKVNRKEFGLNWSAVTEAGGVVVGDEVKLNINVELVKN